jgi:hypothetical protein
MNIGTWTVAQAKAKFSEVLDKARKSGPQTITKKRLGLRTAGRQVGQSVEQRVNLIVRTPFGVGFYAACAIGRVSPDEAMGPV